MGNMGGKADHGGRGSNKGQTEAIAMIQGGNDADVDPG